MNASQRRPLLALSSLCALSAPLLGACGDDDVRLIYVDAGPWIPPPTDSGQPVPEDAGSEDAGSEADAGPAKVGPLTVDTPADSFELDLFGTPGHRFWLDVDDEDLALMNEGRGGGGFPGPLGAGGHYSPDTDPPRTDHLAVQDADSGRVTDLGKVSVRLVGESTGAAWSRTSIPNFRFDTDQFVTDQTLGGYEHFRLNNGQVGTIFREVLAHRIYRALGYPALRTNWAFAGGSVWGKKVWVPMALVEVYKQRFCDDNRELLGGTCEYMWEFAGDPGGVRGGGGDPGPRPIDRPAAGAAAALSWLPANACQVKTCDTARLEEFETALKDAPRGEGFAEALDPFIDWPHFHAFQCLSWMLWTGDDMLHNSNNNLMILRDDGRLVWAPYSIDISLGGVSFGGDDDHPDGYTDVPLVAQTAIASGCQQDPACWADTLDTCRDLITRFDALDPETLVDDAVDTLGTLEMLREGDERRAKRLRDWLVQRQTDLPTELSYYERLPADDGSCASPTDIACAASFCSGAPCVCLPEAECEGLRCSTDTSWCEALQRCVTEDETCPACTEQAPFYCPPADACVADAPACDAECALQNPGWQWCPQFQSCSPSCGIIFG
jgi:hypothetical protein